MAEDLAQSYAGYFDMKIKDEVMYAHHFIQDTQLLKSVVACVTNLNTLSCNMNEGPAPWYLVTAKRPGLERLELWGCSMGYTYLELQVVEGTVDEMLTRLDEFENLLSMVRTGRERSNSADVVLPELMNCQDGLNALWGRVDKLETMVMRVESDFSRVEDAVVQAESDLPSSNAGRLSDFFRPLFSKAAGSEKTSRNPSRTRPDLNAEDFYSVEQFFPENLEDETA